LQPAGRYSVDQELLDLAIGDRFAAYALQIFWLPPVGEQLNSAYAIAADFCQQLKGLGGSSSVSGLYALANLFVIRQKVIEESTDDCSAIRLLWRTQGYRQ
jgi:hypothetical protein